MIKTFFAILFNISINVSHMIEHGIIIKSFCLQCYQENCQYFLSSIILYFNKNNVLDWIFDLEIEYLYSS